MKTERQNLDNIHTPNDSQHCLLLLDSKEFTTAHWSEASEDFEAYDYIYEWRDVTRWWPLPLDVIEGHPGGAKQPTSGLR